MDLPPVPVSKHVKISESWQGLTVFEVVRKAFPEIGPRDAFRKARLREILLNNTPCHPMERLSARDVLTVVLFRPARPRAPSCLCRDREVDTSSGPFRIVWEDADVLAVSKPPGCASHPALGHAGDTLIDRVRAYLGVRPDDAFQPALANRLDLDTSGIILVGKTRRAQRILGRRFQKGAVEKFYLTLVGGWPERTGEIRVPLVKHADSRTRRRLPAGQRPEAVQEASTRFRILDLFEGPPPSALMEVELLTGRTHQIRRHLALLGHPLAADPRYGQPRFNDEVRRVGGLKRMFLHAWRVRLIHPSGGQPLELEAPLPEDLAACLRAMREACGAEANDG